MNKTMLCAALAVIVGALAHAAPAQTERDAVCRFKVGQATRNYTFMTVERALLCHKERLKQNLPAGIDCADPTTWAANGFSRGVFLHNKDRRRVPEHIDTCREDAPSLAALGYTSCPAPCGALPVNNFDELSDCMLCLADACILPAIADVFGTPPLSGTYAAGKCIERAGRHLEHYVNARALVQHVCQVKKERGYPNWGGVADCSDPDSPTHPFFRYLNSYRERKDRIVERRCAAVNLGSELNSCGTTPTDLVNCINARADQCADTLFSAVFP